MSRQLLLSHSHRDRELAAEISGLIEKMSLRELAVWFSSDERSDSGLLPGDRWAERIRAKLAECRAVVALITPQSINRPWLYFESGFGAAAADLEVIPVAIHVSSSEVAYPLRMYQIFQLSDLNHATAFLKKLFAYFDIAWDESLAEDLVEPAMRRILDLASAKFDQGYRISVTTSEGQQVTLAVAREDLIQDVLDSIYYAVQPRVPSHSYLESWILRETSSSCLLIVRGLAAAARARDIFKNGSDWQVVYLDKPYDPSSDREKMEQFYGELRQRQREAALKPTT